MKLKQLLAWILVFAMCFVLVACKDSEKTENDDSVGSAVKKPTEIKAPSEEKDPTEPSDVPVTYPAKGPLLYRVSDKQGNVIWLFGSIHVGREDYYPLPAYVLNAFDNADSLAVEADLIAFEKNTKMQMQALSCLVYKDGTTIKDHIPQELYTKAVEILKSYKSYASALDYYYPIFWSSMIESLLMEKMDGDINLGIDRHLLERAYTNQKEIQEVESVQFQYQMMADFSYELQGILLKSSLEMCEDPDQTNADLKELMDLWASGDEQAFAAYLASEDDDVTDEERPLYEEYHQVMIVDRNLSMTNYAENALKSGKEVFICVGAAHIVGDGAMAQMLAQRGYTVECVTQ